MDNCERLDEQKQAIGLCGSDWRSTLSAGASVRLGGSTWRGKGPGLVALTDNTLCFPNDHDLKNIQSHLYAEVHPSASQKTQRATAWKE